MKLFDLKDETWRQVVVDKEAGQYLGHPTTVLLEDNCTMFVVYPKGHAAGALVLRRSDDAGLTWSQALPVPKNWETSISCPTIHRMTDQSGKSRLIILTGNEGKVSVPVRQAVSEDNGRTWTSLEPIGEPGYSSIVTGSAVVRLKNGAYMALQHFEYGKVLDLYKMLSFDGGLSWSEPVQITNYREAQFCEPGCVRSPSGNQLAVLIRDNSRKGRSYVIFSDDEGDSWTEPCELPVVLTGDRHVARYAPDGRLVVTFRDMMPDSPTRCDWVVWVGAYQDLVDGGEGQYRVRLAVSDGNPEYRWDCAYSGLECLPDGTFVATTYGYWQGEKSPYIISVRFKLEELDSLAKES